jgi:hypothetical protein
MVAANATTAVAFHLSPGNNHDASEGQKLIEHIGDSLSSCSFLMDRAYEGDVTR